MSKPTTKPITFAQWLRRERKIKGLTQAELAESAQLGRTYVSALESGRVILPQRRTRLAIHHILGTSDDEMIDLGILAIDEATGEEYSPQSRPPESPVSATTRSQYVITYGGDSGARKDLWELFSEIELTEERVETLRAIFQSWITLDMLEESS